MNEPKSDVPVATVTGVIVSAEGYILTGHGKIEPSDCIAQNLELHRRDVCKLWG